MRTSSFTPWSFCAFLLISFSGLLSPNTSYAQQSVLDSLQRTVSTISDDSLRTETYLKLCRVLSWREPRITLRYLDTVRAIPGFDQSASWKAWALYYEADANLTLEDEVKGGQLLDAAIAAFEISKDSLGTASCYFQKGVRADLNNDYIAAVQHFKEAKDQYEALNHPQGIAASLNGIGLGYHNARLYEKAKAAYREAFELAKSIPERTSMITFLSNISMIEAEERNFKASIATAMEALSYADGTNRSGSAVANLKANLASNYLELDENAKAKEMAEESLKHFREEGANSNIAHALINLATANNKLGNRKLAIRQFEEVDELLSDGQDLRMQSTLAENLATLYMREDNYRLAFNYQREFSNLKDSMLDEKIATAVAELNTQYETEKKESQLRQVTLENDLAQTKLSNRNIIIGALVGGLLILGLLFFQLLRQRNQISQQKEVIESALSEKEVLLREIHHRVKNNLQVVSSLLSLQSNYIEDETALEALREGRDRVKSMALIHQNLYQEGNLTGIQVEEYFDKLIRSLFNSYNIDPDRIQLETEIATLNLDVETVIPLGLIVNELVSNALKHAFPDEREGLIKIRLLEEQGELLLEVKDNGIGLSGELPTEEINSFGYRLVNAFKEKMSAKLSMDGSDGTTVQLRIKEYVLAA